ncbi:MAG TPA: hypothetical protein VF755_22370 [Catenuloplanes sp.]
MDLAGLWIAVGALSAATAFGLWRRGTDGRLRSAPTAPAQGGSAPVQGGSAPVQGGSVPVQGGSVPVQATAPAQVATAAPAVGAEPIPSTDGSPAVADAAGVDPALLTALGVEPADATLLQFSTVFCAPCRATRRICADVAALLPGVRYIDVDAESHLDAVRALGIWRTPTVLVLDRAGRVVRRATGVPAKAQVAAVLADLLSEQGR